ncbi:hypothetical protein GCM10027422_12080 [Hymenobacter arcticus]
MSIYNTFTINKPRRPSQPGHKVQHKAHGSTPSVGPGYPDLYLEIFFKSDSITKLINPANVWHGDVIILAAPFGTGLSEAFHAPTISLHKAVEGPLLKFDFRYSVSLVGTTKIHVGIGDYFSLDKDVAPVRSFVKVWGWINTVTGEGDFNSKKEGSFIRLGVYY